MPAYKRILLKLSGEALMGDDAFGINRATIVRMVDEIADVTRLGVQVAIVIGGDVLFVDIDPQDETILNRTVRRHPKLQLAGSGDGAPGWVVRTQIYFRRFMKAMP